jgi:hypothetical protein
MADLIQRHALSAPVLIQDTSLSREKEQCITLVAASASVSVRSLHIAGQAENLIAPSLTCPLVVSALSLCPGVPNSIEDWWFVACPGESWTAFAGGTNFNRSLAYFPNIQPNRRCSLEPFNQTDQSEKIFHSEIAVAG